ncbi:MAG: hypothetical protein ABS942_15855 [Solibacillus sp.]
MEFLKATNLAAVILSYAADNNYGHPQQEVLANIKAIGAKAYSTAQDGTIIATINCDGVKIDSKEFKVPLETVQPKPTPVPTSTPIPKPEPVQTGFKNWRWACV